PTKPVDSAWTDEVYMSLNPTLDSSAIALGEFVHAGTLPAGFSYTETQQVTLPVGLSGNYYFIIQTDIHSQLFENGQTVNNVGATPSAITVNLTPPPDLQTSIVSAPIPALASHTFYFTYQVNNIGAGATQLITPGSTWTDAYYLSPTPTYDPATAILIGQEN